MARPKRRQNPAALFLVYPLVRNFRDWCWFFTVRGRIGLGQRIQACDEVFRRGGGDCTAALARGRVVGAVRHSTIEGRT